MTIQQWMSVLAAALFVYIAIGVVLALVVPLKRHWVRFICYSGISAAGLLSLTTAYLYIWENYWR